MKIRRDKLDTLVSEYVRKRAVASVGGCERCLKPHSWKELQCSHFYSRSMKTVRYDEENLCGLCWGCHQFLGSHPVEHIRFFQKRLGLITLDLLEYRAHKAGKPDKKALELYFTIKIKELDEILTER